MHQQNETHIYRKEFDRRSTPSLGGLNTVLQIATNSQAEFNRVSYCQQYETNQLKNKEQGILQNLICRQFYSFAKSKLGEVFKGSDLVFPVFISSTHIHTERN